MTDLPIGVRISQIKHLQSRIFSRILKQETDAGLNGAQFNIIYELWEQDDISISELSQRTELANTTLTSMLDRMENQNLIQRLPNPNNRRQTRIVLTDYARSLEEQYQHTFAKMTTINFHGFTQMEQDTLFALLERLYVNLNQFELEEGE